MSALAAVIRVELAKLGQRASLLGIGALLLGAKALALIEAHHTREALAAEDLQVNGFFVLARGGAFALGPFALLLFVAAAQALAGEQERGLLRMTLVRPVSRAAFYGGRVAAFALASLTVAAADLVLGVVCGLPLGFSDVADVALQGDQYGAGALAGRMLLAYALGALALAATAAVGLCVSACCSQATTAVTAGLVLAVLLIAIELVFPERANWLLPGYVGNELAELVKRTTGVSVFRDAGATVRGIVVPAAWLLGAWVLGWRVFERKEIRG